MRAARSWSFSARSLSSSCSRDMLNGLHHSVFSTHELVTGKLHSTRRVHVQLRVLCCQGLKGFENFSRCLCSLRATQAHFVLDHCAIKVGTTVCCYPQCSKAPIPVPRTKLLMLRWPLRAPRHYLHFASSSTCTCWKPPAFQADGHSTSS